VGLANRTVGHCTPLGLMDRQRALHEAEQELERARCKSVSGSAKARGAGLLLFWQGSSELALAAFENELYNHPAKGSERACSGAGQLISLEVRGRVPSIERGIAALAAATGTQCFLSQHGARCFSLGRFRPGWTWAEKAIATRRTMRRDICISCRRRVAHGDQARAKSCARRNLAALQPKYDSVAAFRAPIDAGEVPNVRGDAAVLGGADRKEKTVEPVRAECACYEGSVHCAVVTT